ncbi:Mitochondrial import inner membrane translocase [Actinidia chinensis var. chinensis]|uniref:Mitochondrial import inner membrane translocase subunit n=1 Tax=Actinidia chinensis var. chinensis TaxID=1590841 RepID=A0A2R6QGA2_ACTCC|nr:mitochondrial import inner membrane translocase subunit TIM8 [Actinidia eriantha]XP_057459785.1 mitochondrial import inner membrane translocase subunit TIM8 [Actinidia eriantha]PSS07637.1 Mitochondrial import inner membrane translocase [Actinidia chinensis var. chinensis]
MDPSSLNSAELQHFINKEKEKAMVNEMVAKLTTVCWDKCITSTPGSKFSSSESSCLSNCAQRYMDMSIIIMKRFQSMNSMQ